MAEILFSGSDTAFMHTLPDTLRDALEQQGLARDLQVSSAAQAQEIARGDPISLTTVALTAAGAGGALTVMLGKDGFLSALARVLEKYIESRKTEIRIKTEDGREIEISGPVGRIEGILKELVD